MFCHSYGSNCFDKRELWEKYLAQNRLNLHPYSYDGKKLKAMSTFPGLTVEYSTDGKTWKEVGDESHVEGKNVKLRTRLEDVCGLG